MQALKRRSSGSSALIGHLSSITSLAAHEIRFLENQCAVSYHVEANRELHAEHDRANQRVLMSGWACRQRLLPDGRRQIIILLVPGDVVGPLQMPVQPAIGSSVALTRVEIADATAILQNSVVEAQFHSGLAKARRMLLLLEDVFLHDQIVRLGRQTAYERTLHLMLELRFRLALAGLATTTTYAMPLTQDVLADSLGLSLVHANRTLQQLRRDGLMELRMGQVTLFQPELMERIANWSPPFEIGPFANPDH